jgi:type I restriction enzyme S subunit
MSDVMLGGLCSLIVDSEHKTAPKDPDGLYPLIRTTDLGRARADLSSAQRVNGETHALWTKRAVPTVGDLILAREAPVGGICRVSDGVEPVLGQRTVLLRPDPTSVDGQFLMYRLASDDLQARMAEMSTGSTVPHLNMADIRTFPVPQLPPFSAQRRIGAVLAAFDELIEINERRIELLEDLARSLYREWFVHFRFPGHEDVEFVESELGPIPQGWKAKCLFDVADVAFGYPFKARHFSGSGMYPVIRIRDVPRGTTDTFTDEEPDFRYQVSDGDVLIGMDGTFYVHQWSGGTAWLNQRVARLRPVGDLGGCYLMHAVRGPVMQLNGSIVGTTVSHLGKRHLQEVRLVVPSHPIREAATGLFEAIGSEQIFCEQQIRALAATRDLLLPRLVTGQLDISDIDLGVLTPAETE